MTFTDMGDMRCYVTAVQPHPERMPDCLYEHAVLNQTAIDRFMPPDVTYFALFRHPVSLFESSVAYFKHDRITVSRWYLKKLCHFASSLRGKECTDFQPMKRETPVNFILVRHNNVTSAEEIMFD